MTLKLGLIRDKNKQCKLEFCADLQPHTHSENNLRNKSLDRLLKPQLSFELLTRENKFKSMYSSTYKRFREITSKAHEYRNRFKLGRPLEVGQKVLLENHKPDLFKSQKLKQLRVGPFTVTRQITNTTYEIKEDENLENVKITHRNHLLEYFPKEETLPPLLKNYAPIEQDDIFYKHLIQRQIDTLNSGQSEHKLDFMPLIITPFQGRTTILPKVLSFPPVPILDSCLRQPHNSTPQYQLRLTTPFRGTFPSKLWNKSTSTDANTTPSRGSIATRFLFQHSSTQENTGSPVRTSYPYDVSPRSNFPKNRKVI